MYWIYIYIHTYIYIYILLKRDLAYFFATQSNCFKYCSYLSYPFDWGWQLYGLFRYQYFLYNRIYLRILSIPETHCLFILLGDIVLDVEGSVSNLAESSLNALTGLSLFTLVFTCIFPAWPTGTCDFSLSGSGFLGDNFF